MSADPGRVRLAPRCTTVAPRIWVAALLTLAACSPEARRVRDGGPGADPGNKVLVARRGPDPHAADSTLWPGRAIAPVDLQARGIIAPPTYPRPVTPAVPISPQRTDTAGRPAGPAPRDSARGSPQRAGSGQ